MKKWIFGIIFLTIILFGYYVHSLTTGDAERSQAFKKAESTAYQEIGLTDPIDFYMYRGQESWDVITGKNSNDVKVAVWIPKDKKEQIFALPLSSGISREQALSILKENREPFEIIHTKLGCEQGKPVWEITYTNVEDKLCYFYIDFKTGEWLKSYDNL